MNQLTITAKIQIIATDEEKEKLKNTIYTYRDACNYVSDYIFRTHDLQQFSINKILYSTLRKEFGLKSQMTQSVFKTVIAKYKTFIKDKNWKRINFKKPQYDLVWNRDYSLTNQLFSINTLYGRIKLPYYSKGMEKYFDQNKYKFGTAKLVFKHEKYYLHIPVTYEIEECNINNVCNVVGIDRGINFIIATYDSNHKTKFVSGKFIKHKRKQYKKIREQLQRTKTPSSRQRLKSIGSRENRWIRDINHQISKALVEENPSNTIFVLEDLSGIRNATKKTSLKNRYLHTSWAFYDFEQKLIYKAKQKQGIVIKVNPAYTSQTCPICGYVKKTNRNKRYHVFHCKNCGYKSNDDRIAAMNLYHMGIDYLRNNNAKVPDTVTLK